MSYLARACHFYLWPKCNHHQGGACFARRGHSLSSSLRRAPRPAPLRAAGRSACAQSLRFRWLVLAFWKELSVAAWRVAPPTEARARRSHPSSRPPSAARKARRRLELAWALPLIVLWPSFWHQSASIGFSKALATLQPGAAAPSSPSSSPRARCQQKVKKFPSLSSDFGRLAAHCFPTVDLTSRRRQRARFLK